jgi:hypothetical protein
MPTVTFDVTENAQNHAVQTMEKMPGNEGQASLVSSLSIDAYAKVEVRIAGPIVDIDVDYDISINSSHPEAIGQIISKGEQAFQEYAERAADILGLVRQAFDSL